MSDFKQGDRIIYAGSGGVIAAIDGLVNNPQSSYSGFGKVTIFLDHESKSRRVSPYELKPEPPLERVLEVPDYVQTYRDYWADIVEDGDGNLNLDQVMRELHDYTEFMGQASEVYAELTGGRISKPNTMAFEVIAEADELNSRLTREYVADELQHMTVQEVHEWIQKNLG